MVRGPGSWKKADLVDIAYGRTLKVKVGAPGVNDIEPMTGQSLGSAFSKLAPWSM